MTYKHTSPSHPTISFSVVKVQGLLQKAVERDVKRFQHMNSGPGPGTGAGPSPGAGAAATVRNRYKGQGGGGGGEEGAVDIDMAVLPFTLRGNGGNVSGGGDERGSRSGSRSGVGAGVGAGSGVGVQGVISVYPHVSIADAFWLCGEIKRVRGDMLGARNLLSPGRQAHTPSQSTNHIHNLLIYHTHQLEIPHTPYRSTTHPPSPSPPSFPPLPSTSSYETQSHVGICQELRSTRSKHAVRSWWRGIRWDQ